jgi:hypothetical protein
MPVNAVAFPYGDSGSDPAVTRTLLQRIGYRAGFLYGGGPNELPAGDRYGLTRLAMGPDTDLGPLLADGDASW